MTDDIGDRSLPSDHVAARIVNHRATTKYCCQVRSWPVKLHDEHVSPDEPFAALAAICDCHESISQRTLGYTAMLRRSPGWAVLRQHHECANLTRGYVNVTPFVICLRHRLRKTQHRPNAGAVNVPGRETTAHAPRCNQRRGSSPSDESGARLCRIELR